MQRIKALEHLDNRSSSVLGGPLGKYSPYTSAQSSSINTQHTQRPAFQWRSSDWQIVGKILWDAI
jgi:hypothetical protein